jgi:hypothetical protein
VNPRENDASIGWDGSLDRWRLPSFRAMAALLYRGVLAQQTAPCVVDNRRDEGGKLPVTVLLVRKFGFFVSCGMNLA